MKKYTHIKKEERNEISILVNKGYKLRDIAKALDRDVGTISRELSRNHRKKRGKDGPYEPSTANHKAYVRRKYAKCQNKKIRENKEMLSYIENGLKNGLSPDVISGRMVLEQQPFFASKTAIYEYVYSAYGQHLCKYLPSKKYNRKPHNKSYVKKVMIPNRVGIELRNEEINTKSTYGHWEGDTIVSGKQHHTTTALAVLYERKARYIKAENISSLKPDVYNQAVINMSKGIPLFLSCTLDNGIENTHHTDLKTKLNIDTYFCDPYSSWQKPGVENANKLIRRFIPKGANINNYSNRYIQNNINKLNNIPRKSLGYKTPAEVMHENNLLVVNNLKLVDNRHLLERALVALRG